MDNGENPAAKDAPPPSVGMPSISVSIVGISGSTYLSDVMLAPQSTIGELRAMARASMGITGPGLEVTLLSNEMAALTDDQEQVQTVIEDGSCITAVVEDIVAGIRDLTDLPMYEGRNLAEAAGRGAWHDVLRLVEAGADTGATWECGYTALMHLASVPHGSEHLATLDPLVASQLMTWLVMRGADAKALDSNKKTALHIWGKYGGSLEQGRVLVNAGADVNHQMNGGYTPLWYVRNYKRPEFSAGPATEIDVHAAERRARASRKRDEGQGAPTADEAESTELWVLADRMLLEQDAKQIPAHFDY